MNPVAKVVIMEPYPHLCSLTHDSFCEEINKGRSELQTRVHEASKPFGGAEKIKKQDEFARNFAFKTGITFTTPEFLAGITNKSGGSIMQDLVLLVDEVDMISPAKTYSFEGAEYFMQACCFYGCTASPLTAQEKTLLCPPQHLTIKQLAESNSTVAIDRMLTFIEESELAKHITKQIVTYGQKVVLFCKDFEHAQKQHGLLTMDGDNTTKKSYYLLDLDEAHSVEKGKNKKLFKGLNENRTVECIVTCQMGIRGLNYWKQCHPIALFPIKTWSDYTQFMGRSNREFPNKLTQRGTIVVRGATHMDQDAFEKKLTEIDK